MLANVFSASVRRGIYVVVAAALPLAVYYGIVTADVVPMWLGLAAAVLGLTMAAGNAHSSPSVDVAMVPVEAPAQPASVAHAADTASSGVVHTVESSSTETEPSAGDSSRLLPTVAPR